MVNPAVILEKENEGGKSTVC